MAGFGFTEAQEMFRRQMRDFALRELAPTAKERAKCELPREMFKKIADMGLFGITLPQKYGGQGADWVSLGIAVEELAKVDFSVSLLPVSSVMFQFFLSSPEEVWREWLSPIIKGDKIGCFALTEPGAGTDAVAITTRAIRSGDYYILDGEKTSISMGSMADVGMLFAKTDPEAGAKGVSCFWVPLDLPGITRTALQHTGWKSYTPSSIFMEGVRLPSKYLIGEEGKGFYIAMGAIDCFRVGLGLMALGLAQASLEEATTYATQRTAFGRPIAKFEDVSFKIAEHATLIEAARLLCYRALYLRDQGLPHTKESAMCKWFCPVVSFKAIHDCILIHGHIGYSEEYPLEQRLRDCLGLEFTDSTEQIMKIIIARELMGRIAVPY